MTTIAQSTLESPRATANPAAAQPFRLLCGAAAIVYLSIVAWSARAVFWLGEDSLYAENGPLEDLQAALLMASCAVFLAASPLAKGAARWLHLFCALLCCSFVFRELDVAIDLGRALPFLPSDDHREALVGIGFAALVGFAALRFREYWSAGLAFLRSRPGVLLLLAGGALLAGSVFEQIKAIERHAYIEEILELGGCLLILMSALTAAAVAIRHRRARV